MSGVSASASVPQSGMTETVRRKRSWIFMNGQWIEWPAGKNVTSINIETKLRSGEGGRGGIPPVVDD